MDTSADAGAGGGESTRAFRILVADDEEMIRILLAEILTDEGYEVITVNDGQQAIDRLRGELFDLLITDLVMPAANGIEVLRVAKEIDQDYPVIIITGYPSVENVVRLVKLGAADYLTKPFDVDVVKATVAKLLAQRPPRDEETDLGPPGDGNPGDGNPGDGPVQQEPEVDDLTDVLTTERFSLMLEDEVERSGMWGHACSLLIAAVDNFEPYALKGDDASDEVLRRFLGAMRQEVRPGDVIARIDEAELAVILADTAVPDAVALGKRVPSTVEWYFTISAGVACFPVHAANAADQLKAARAAMEAAKAQGGNTILHLDDTLPGVRGVRAIY